MPEKSTRQYRYVWEAAYLAALDEVDEKRLHERINASMSAIEQRLLELNEIHSSGREREALRDAKIYLNLLRQHSLPDQSRGLRKTDLHHRDRS